jgi:DNA-binding MarR family transcriptional regulator
MVMLSNPVRTRAELIAVLTDAGSANSTATVLFHAAMARRFGVSVTDWKCGEWIMRLGAPTAGELARATSLTTGAITGVIDRLEKAGLARRLPDPNDRRRVLVQVTPEHVTAAHAAFASFLRAWENLVADYSDEELALILHFQEHVTAMLVEEAAKLSHPA